MQKNSSAYFKTTQLDANVWAIEDIKSSENTICYLICGKTKAILFDTGLGLSPVSPIVDQLTSLPIMVILSHWHFDHSGGAWEFGEVLGWQTKNMVNASTNGIDGSTIIEQAGDQIETSAAPVKLGTKPYPQIKFLSDDQIMDFDGFDLQVVHTPGHTQDSICLYEKNKKWLFTGDTVYHGPIYLQFAESSLTVYMTSIEKLLGLEVKTILPGHNSVSESPDLLVEISSMLNNAQYKSKYFPALSIQF